jgi:NAD(P)-dependent dehydrogenase (short-subunit alcohol dehydrogenase family)
VGRLFSRASDEFGPIDGVVHAAAVLAYGRFVDVPQDVFDRTLATNITGTANVAREALHLFQVQESGSLVVLGSVLSKMAAPLMSPYGTSKWAVHGLVRTLQIEAREMTGITISLVSPGGVNTPIYNQAGSYTGHPGHPPPPVFPRNEWPGRWCMLWTILSATRTSGLPTPSWSSDSGRCQASTTRWSGR